MDDSDFPRTPDRPVKLLGTRVRYQRSVETTIDARGPNFLGGSAIGVMGSRSPRSKASMIAMFWLVRAKCGRAPSSSVIL